MSTVSTFVTWYLKVMEIIHMEMKSFYKSHEKVEAQYAEKFLKNRLSWKTRRVSNFGFTLFLAFKVLQRFILRRLFSGSSFTELIGDLAG